MHINTSCRFPRRLVTARQRRRSISRKAQIGGIKHAHGRSTKTQKPAWDLDPGARWSLDCAQYSDLHCHTFLVKNKHTSSTMHRGYSSETCSGDFSRFSENKKTLDFGFWLKVSNISHAQPGRAELWEWGSNAKLEITNLGVAPFATRTPELCYYTFFVRSGGATNRFFSFLWLDCKNFNTFLLLFNLLTWWVIWKIVQLNW